MKTKTKKETIKYMRTLEPNIHFGALLRVTVQEPVPEEWNEQSFDSMTQKPRLRFPTVAALEHTAMDGFRLQEVQPANVPPMPEVYESGMVFMVRDCFADPLGLFVCSGGGFGCDPDKIGRAVFGLWLSEPENTTGCRVDRGDLVRLATLGEIALAAKFIERDEVCRLRAQLDCYRQQSTDMYRALHRGNPTKAELQDAVYTIYRNAEMISSYAMLNWSGLSESERARRAAFRAGAISREAFNANAVNS